jgi:NADH-quinone oxidoreductase subunit N
VNYTELLTSAAPETIVVIAALAVLMVDLLGMRDQPRQYRLLISAAISAMGCIASFLWLTGAHEPASFPEGTGFLVVGPLTQMVKQGVLVLTFFTLLLSIEAEFTDHIGEYFALVLLGTVGMMFLISAEDLLIIFLGLELTSLSLYILTAFNKNNPQSAEAALKYFLFGGMAAAVSLFGLSLLYGRTGATNLRTIASVLSQSGALSPSFDPLLVLALVMVVAGFGFKIAAVPFHLWAPDAYQGAPTPSAALIASGSKVASFFILAKVMLLAFKGAEGSAAWQHFASGWMPVIALLAALSMILGNFTAIVQSSVRRLLAYSAIAHSGYMLLAILANNQETFSSLLFYITTYGLTVIGAFGVVAVVERQTGSDAMTSFAGLSRRAPALSLCMMVFMLSLAGIPPLAGFFGKFYLFYAAINADAKSLGLLWLVVLAIAMSAVSLYYYLMVLKQIYIAETSPKASERPISLVAQVPVILLALGVVVFGIAPGLLLERLQSAVHSAGF